MLVNANMKWFPVYVCLAFLIACFFMRGSALPHSQAQRHMNDAAAVSTDVSTSAYDSNSAATLEDGDVEGRELRQTSVDAVDMSSGPAFPVFLADIVQNYTDVAMFVEPTMAVRADLYANVKPRIPLACDASLTAQCDEEMLDCFAEDPEYFTAVCNCYDRNARCYRALHCFDLLTRTQIHYCFDTMRCPLDLCEGTSGAAAVPFAHVLVAACAILMLMSLW
jgi:hypothetical protein